MLKKGRCLVKEDSALIKKEPTLIKYYNYDIVFQEFPDEVTLAINLSLCPNGCPGCHGSYLQGDIGEELTEERLLALLADFEGEITSLGLMGETTTPREWRGCSAR